MFQSDNVMDQLKKIRLTATKYWERSFTEFLVKLYFKSANAHKFIVTDLLMADHRAKQKVMRKRMFSAQSITNPNRQTMTGQLKKDVSLA